MGWHPLRRLGKILLWVLGTLVALMVVAAIGLYALLHSSYLLEQAQGRASKATGRAVTIGALDVDWSWTPVIHLRDVNLANSEWGEAEQMFSAETVAFAIKPWPLLGGHVVLPFIRIEAPKVSLEKRKDGTSNWDFNENPVAATAVEAVRPDDRAEAPFIGQLEITKGKIAYRDASRKLKLDGDIDLAAGEAAGNDPTVEFKAEGTLEERPLKLAFKGGSIAMLRDTEHPYPLDLRVDYGATFITLKGTVGDPFTFGDANVKMHLKGPDLADVFPLLGIPAPSTPPYDLAGDLKRTPKEWRLENMKGRIGNSDVTGVVAVEPREKRNYLEAKLVSNNLDFDDLGPLIGIPPETDEAASKEQKKEAGEMKAEGNLFPDKPLQTEKLRAMDMDVTLDAKKVTAAPYLPVKAITFNVKVDDGNAQLSKLNMAIANGTVTGKMGLDARKDVPIATAELFLKNLDLKTFFKDSEYIKTTNGKVGGKVTLEGQGKSLAQVFGVADGAIELGMTGGSFSGLMLALADLDIQNALFLYITDDNQIPVRCVAGGLTFSNGNAKFSRTLIDTKESVIYVNGNIDLKSQTLKTELDADSKVVSVLNIPAPILVEGKIRKPKFSLGKGFPIPIPRIGDAEDKPCDKMLNDIFSPS
ncbi:AsmA family protein [Dongia sp.]|uniref:AsmA family protein n=1 Tax=Dongia sp. TaxID=1977262 RepID=UPI0037539D78